MKIIENGLVPIYEGSNGPAVSARELHAGLKVDTKFTDWIKGKFEKYGFVENEDYMSFSENSDKPLGGRPTAEYVLTLDCAKEIAMVENNEQGRIVRRYFIEVEKKHNNLPLTLDAMLGNPDAFIGLLNAYKEEKAKTIEMLPKAQFYDAVTGSHDAVDMGAAAKVLHFGKGRTTLFQMLRENKILMSGNLPYQEYIDRGYFRVIESNWSEPDGTQHISKKTVVYQRGLDFIRKLLIKQGYMKETGMVQ